VCLIERCRAPQNGYTPLHLAAVGGHATVVEQLLAAGAVTNAKTKVRQAGDASADRAGSGGDTWRVVVSVFPGLCWFPHQVMC
jgi:hypothetical protein